MNGQSTFISDPKAPRKSLLVVEFFIILLFLEDEPKQVIIFFIFNMKKRNVSFYIFVIQQFSFDYSYW